MSANKGAFHNLLVIELASVLAGPSVGQFFAEMGATVLKVENIKTSGDVTRRWKLSSESPTTTVSAYFAAANWGKQSLCVDLSVPVVQEALCTIVGQADVVLTSFKPGDAEKLHMDYATLSASNKRLVYGHITGYGPESPRAGYDAVLQAEAGFMYLNGEKGGKPLKMPVALIDLLAAHQLKEGLLTALYLREKTGQGQYVEVSLLKTAISSLANQATNYLVAGQAPERMGSEHPNIVPYGSVFLTADEKEMVLAVGDDRQFAALCQILIAPELADSPKYKTNKDRVLHRDKLNGQLTKLIKKQTRDRLLHQLEDKHVPAGAVFSVPEALLQPLAQAQILDTNVLRGIRQVAFQMPSQENLSLTAPPQLGANTWQVLEEWAGLTKEQIQDLAQKQVIYPANPEKE